MVLWQAWAEGFLWGTIWGMKIFGASCALAIIMLLVIFSIGLVGNLVKSFTPSTETDKTN